MSEKLPENALSGLLDVLRNDPHMGPKIKETEEIESAVKDAVDFIELEIAYSPVIMRPGDTTQDAVKVAYKGRDGRYVITEPYKVVTADELKVMRARYLVTRGKEIEPTMDRMFGKGK